MSTDATTVNDRPEVLADVKALLADKLERAALALWLMTFNTPEDTGIKLAQRGEWLLESWAGPGMRESDRALYRRRAAMVIDVHRKRP